MEVELQLMEVKENLKKVESGPFTLGTTLDSSLQESVSVSLTSVIKGRFGPRLELVLTTPLPFQSRGAAAVPAPQISSSSATTSQSLHVNSSMEAASPVVSVSVLKPRPASNMATKGKVLQKAKVRADPSQNQRQLLHAASVLNVILCSIHRSGRRNPPPKREPVSQQNNNQVLVPVIIIIRTSG